MKLLQNGITTDYKLDIIHLQTLLKFEMENKQDKALAMEEKRELKRLNKERAMLRKIEKEREREKRIEREWRNQQAKKRRKSK